MVFNQSTKFLVEQAGALDVCSHDWWFYLLVSGAGGEVFYDPIPQVLYRQHKYSLVGGKHSFLSKIKRARMLWQGRFRHWNTQNISALKQVKHLIDKNHQETLRMFEVLRGASLIDRFRLMEICGLYRQTRRETFSLFIAILFRKI
jgi:hypothetical protein